MNLKSILNLENFLKISIVLFFLLMCYYHSLTESGSGDELLFITDLNFIKTHGWIAAIQKSIALPYLILAYPFSFLFEDYVALRLVNVLLFGLLLVYFYKWGSIKNKLFYYYFLFLGGFGWFMIGTNDVLIVVSLAIFFNETYKLLEHKEKSNVVLLWCALITAFFSRELIYIHLPAIFLSIYLMWKQKISLTKKFYIPALLFAFFILINLPSIEKNHKLSYDDKTPPKEITAGWAQRQYLAQLLVNEGKLKDQQHPSWEETMAYLSLHGENSLPKSISGGILFDIKLTIKEFFKDFISCIWYSIRQTGFIFIILLGFLFYKIVKRDITENLYLPFINFLTTAIFSLIIISYIEPRWLMITFILSMIYFSDLEYNKSIHKNIVLLNHIVLILVVFYGTYKVFLKL